MAIFSFERLEAYEQALNLVSLTYEISEKFPSHEKFGLYSQLHRSILSIPSNIAESCGRTSFKEKIHFLEIAYGSLLEAYCQLQVAAKVGYITMEELGSIQEQFHTVSRLINGLSKSYHKLLNP